MRSMTARGKISRRILGQGMGPDAWDMKDKMRAVTSDPRCGISHRCTDAKNEVDEDECSDSLEWVKVWGEGVGWRCGVKV